MPCIRVKKQKTNFFIHDKTCLNDVRLSWKAKGLHSYLMSKPDEWKVHVNHLRKNSRDGRDSVYNTLNELERYGYLLKIQNRTETNKFASYDYMVSEESCMPENVYVMSTFTQETLAQTPIQSGYVITLAPFKLFHVQVKEKNHLYTYEVKAVSLTQSEHLLAFVSALSMTPSTVPLTEQETVTSLQLQTLWEMLQASQKEEKALFQSGVSYVSASSSKGNSDTVKNGLNKKMPPVEVPLSSQPTEASNPNSSDCTQASVEIQPLSILSEQDAFISDSLSNAQHHRIKHAAKELMMLPRFQHYSAEKLIQEITFVMLTPAMFAKAGNDFMKKLNTLKKCMRLGNWTPPVELHVAARKQVDTLLQTKEAEMREVQGDIAHLKNHIALSKENAVSSQAIEKLEQQLVKKQQELKDLQTRGLAPECPLEPRELSPC